MNIPWKNLTVLELVILKTLNVWKKNKRSLSYISKPIDSIQQLDTKLPVVKRNIAIVVN